MAGGQGRDDEASPPDRTLTLEPEPQPPTRRERGPKPARETPAGPELARIERERYRLEGEQGRGGLGRVLRAHDLRLGRVVALKELLTVDPDGERRFIREALVTARLQHPAIVPVYEAGRWPSGEPFYAMRMVPGRSLSGALREAPDLPARTALLASVIAAAKAVAYAHSEGVIHRDLKPSNIMLGPFGETVVIDWGLAKDLRAAAETAVTGEPQLSTPGATRAGAVMGTPGFMAPEQAEGRAADERVDVYALGAILYAVLGGRPPSQGSSTQEILASAAAGPVPLAEVEPRLPADLCAIVARAMAREPAARYPTAGELADDLERFQTGRLVQAYRYPVRAHVARFVRRHRVAFLVGAVLVTALVVTAVLAISRVLAARRVAEQRAVEATEARRVAEQRSAGLVLANVRAALDRDPTQALAWLKQYPSDGPELGAARILAADAAPGAARHVLAGHERGVRAVAFAPDGSWVASLGDDQAVRVWETASGRERWTSRLPAAGTALAAASDGATLAAGTSDGRIILWPMAGGPPRTLNASRKGIDQLVFVGDGRQLVSSAADGAVRLWTVADGSGPVLVDEPKRMLQSLAVDPTGHRVLVAGRDWLFLWDVATARGQKIERQNVMVAALAPQGDTLALGGVDGTVTLVTAAGQTVREVAHLAHTVTRLAFSPDGHWLAASASEIEAHVYPLDREGDRTLTLGAPLSTWAFSPDSSQLATVAWSEHQVSVWQLGQPTVRILSGHGAAVADVAFSPDGAWLASASADRTVRLWPAHVPGPRTLESPPYTVQQLAFSPDGRRLAVATTEGEVRVWSVADGDAQLIGKHAAHFVTGMAFADHGTLLVTAAEELRVWDLERGGHRVLGSALGPISVMVADRSGQLLAAAYRDGIRLWSLTGEAPRRLAELGQVSRLALSGDGAWLAAAWPGGRIVLWRLADGRQRELALPGVARLGFSSDGSLLAIGGDRGITLVVHTADGTQRTLVNGIAGVRALDFDPAGHLLATGGEDGQVRVWTLADGSGRSLRGHGDVVESVRFSRDGQRLVTGAGAVDPTVRLWDVASGEGRVLGSHRGPVIRADFSPDGRLIASGSTDGVIELWSDDTPADTAGLASWIDVRTSAVIVDGAPRTP